MEFPACARPASQEIQCLNKNGVPVPRREYMDLDEFLLVASNFNGSKTNVYKDKVDIAYGPQALSETTYNSFLAHISNTQKSRNGNFFADRRFNNIDSRDSGDFFHSDESSNDESRDGSEFSPAERVSQAVSVIVNDSKEQDANDSSGDSVDSGFGAKANSVNYDEQDDMQVEGGGKNKTRRRRKSEYIYNPLPVGRKSTRKFVPSDKKDDRYWEQRIKNNIAAKRSREARRQKEMEILNRCQALIDENGSLKDHNERLQCRIDELEQRLELYNKMVTNDNVVLVKV